MILLFALSALFGILEDITIKLIFNSQKLRIYKYLFINILGERKTIGASNGNKLFFFSIEYNTILSLNLNPTSF